MELWMGWPCLPGSREVPCRGPVGGARLVGGAMLVADEPVEREAEQVEEEGERN